MRFEIAASDPASTARCGVLATPHGEVQTPAFMPVGTVGAVKTMTPDDLVSLGVQILLGNAYHLLLRPGPALIEKAGGLHAFMGWRGPILTDSGGYQVFSLADLLTLTDDGVSFRSHLDGSEQFLSPERAVDLQWRYGSDISMVLDDCPPHDGGAARIGDSVRRTVAWAGASRAAFLARVGSSGRGQFGIVQGGTDPQARLACAEQLLAFRFEGYAIGGLSVGESRTQMSETAARTAAALPSDRPRYLMGVGTPEELWTCVAAGVDLFDCVLPTRTARNGLLFTSRGRLNLKNAALRDDLTPPDRSCACYTCTRFSRAYLRHLLVVGEYLYGRLATLHNLSFYMSLMRTMRAAIAAGRFDAARRAFLDAYRSEGRGDPDREAPVPPARADGAAVPS